MKYKIILPVPAIALCLMLFSCTREKTGNANITKPLFVRQDDSLVFKQLMQIGTFRKADSLYMADSYDSAIYYFDKTFFRQTFNHNSDIKQQILNRAGYTYILKADYKNAALYLNKAFAYTSGKDSGLVNASTYECLGVLYDYTNQPDSALLYLQKAYKIYEKTIGDKNLKIVTLYNRLGHVYRYSFNDYYNAEKYLYKALQIFESLGPVKNYDLYLNLLHSLASTTNLKKDFNKALTYGLRNLQLAKSVKEGKRYLEICYGLLGNIYMGQQDYKKSTESFYNALEVNLGSINPNREYRVRWLTCLALANLTSKEFQNTILYCNQALTNIDPQNPDYISMAFSYEYLGSAFLELKQWVNALACLRLSLDLRLKKLGAKNFYTAYSYQMLGNYYKARLKLDSALYYYQKALIAGSEKFANLDFQTNPTVKEIRTNPGSVDYLNGKALVLKQKFSTCPKDTSFLLQSLKCYELADSLISYSRKTMETETSKLSYTTNSSEWYENAIDCAYQLYEVTKSNKYINQAFRFFEKNKYLLLLENLKTAEAAHKAGIPDSLAESERNLNVELKFVQQKLDEEQLKKNKDASRIQKMNEQVFEVMRKMEKLHTLMEQNYPSYYKIKYQEPSISVTDLQTRFMDKNTSIVQYFWGQNAVYVICVSRNTINFSKINDGPEFREYLNRYIQLSREVNFNSRVKYWEYATKAKYLFDKLMSVPMKGKDQKEAVTENLIVIPDGMLSKLSFEALVTSLPNTSKFSYKNLDYLIYHSNVQYAYSSNILLGKNSEHKRYVNKLLGFGYSGDDKDEADRLDNKELPGTYKELKAVSKYFRSSIYFGNKATIENFKDHVSSYDILHLALHGVANEENENGTGLIFRTEKNKEGNGYLNANEIYNLNLRAKMVVLSACETGLGKNFKGEGVFSMARAFSYAGCPTVVISLWNVNDRSTANLMGKFYKHLSKGEEIGNALRNAKLEYLRQSDEIGYQPVLWASFVAFGDMSPLQSNPNHIIWVGFAVILIFACVSLCYWIVLRSKRVGH